jgi:hypothetical protein
MLADPSVRGWPSAANVTSLIGYSVLLLPMLFFVDARLHALDARLAPLARAAGVAYVTFASIVDVAWQRGLIAFVELVALDWTAGDRGAQCVFGADAWLGRMDRRAGAQESRNPRWRMLSMDCSTR